MHKPDPQHVETDVQRALSEDLGHGDISAELIPKDARGQATVITRDDAVIAGIPWAQYSFLTVDSDIDIQWHCEDGDQVNPGQTLCDISGPARALLSAERTALNFLQTLSAVATQTAAFVSRIKHTNCKVLDTRKTLPGLRYAQKYATRCGGGHNHRMGLFDAFLIKENHIAAAGSIAAAIQAAQQHHQQALIEIEVEDLEQLVQAMDAGAQRVLLDNFTPARLVRAVALNRGLVELEASGGINLSTVAAIAETGVDFVSVGAITKDIQAVDLSMRFI